MAYDPQMFGNNNTDSLMMDLAAHKVMEDDWLAPISEGLQATQLDCNPTTMRRVSSTPAVKFAHYPSTSHMKSGWGDSTAPLPIRSMNSSFSPSNDYSSLESSQTLLAGAPGSFSDESAFLHRQGSMPISGRHALLPGGSYRHQSLPNHQMGILSASQPLMPADALAAIEIDLPMPPPAPAGQSGHWAWIPASVSGPTLVNPPAPTPVPISSGVLPLPLPMGSTLDLDDLDIEVLDSINVLEMADTLGPDDPLAGPHQGHHIHHQHQFSSRVVGSCPLPALLEDSLSNDDGSEHTMHRANTSSPPIDELEIGIPFGTSLGGGNNNTNFSLHSNYTGSVGSRGISSHANATARQTIPIPGARTAPLKVHRPSRSMSSPHMASTLLATSCPSSGMDATRPMRNAARRSLAVTAAALRDVEDDDDDDDDDDDNNIEASDSDISDEMPRLSSSYGDVSRRMGGGGGGSLHGHHHSHNHNHGHHHQSHGSNSGKKKHNPWSIEETLALVEGVRQAGVGKWAEIKRLSTPGISLVLESRSAVDLKDKWRNLTRVARLPKAALKTRLQKSPSDVPLETMLLVKQLMESRHDGE